MLKTVSKVGLVGLVASFVTACSSDPQITEKPFDYCQLTEFSDNADEFMASGSGSPTELFQSDSEAIENLVVKPENIVGNPEPDPNKYQVVLVPVGYAESPDSMLSDMIRKMSAVYKGINIEFSYLNFSVPIGLEHLERLLIPSNFKEALSVGFKIAETFPIDGIAFIVNSKKYLGGAHGSRISFSSGNSEDSLQLTAHELSHTLSLENGNQQYYPKWQFPGSEFFTMTSIRADIAKYLFLVEPEIVLADGVCNGQTVYTFYPHEFNLMKHFYSKKKMESRIASNGAFFTPLQIYIMNGYIKRDIKPTKIK